MYDARGRDPYDTRGRDPYDTRGRDPYDARGRDPYDQRRPQYMYQEEEDDTCGLCLKYLLLIFNIIIVLGGIGVCAGCIWILISKSFVSDIMNNDLMTISCWLIILGSAITIFVSITGCCGAIKDSQRLLLAYAGILTFLAFVLLTGGFMAVVLKGEIGEWVITEMEETLKDHYGVDLDNKYNQIVTQAWDMGQEEMFCCAVRPQGWGIYRQSLWYAEQPGIEKVDKPYVPATCCKMDQYGEYLDLKLCQTFYLGPPGLSSGMHNQALHYNGCYEAGEDWIDYYSTWLAALGIGLAVVLVSGIVSSIWLAIKLYKKTKFVRR